jgi:hypothetical protein
MKLITNTVAGVDTDTDETSLKYMLLEFIGNNIVFAYMKGYDDPPTPYQISVAATTSMAVAATKYGAINMVDLIINGAKSCSRTKYQLPIKIRLAGE